MTKLIFVCALSGCLAFLTTPEAAQADHRSCGYGYSIGGYASPDYSYIERPDYGYRTYYRYPYSRLSLGYGYYGGHYAGHYGSHRGHFGGHGHLVDTTEVMDITADTVVDTVDIINGTRIE